jgi:hypothetical protein
MRTDMQRLNELIAKNTGLQEYLANAIFDAETDFTERLRELQVCLEICERRFSWCFA